jgi:hypothetical protein
LSGGRSQEKLASRNGGELQNRAMKTNELRSVKTTRHRIEGLLNKAKIRLGATSVGRQKLQSHGFVRVMRGNAGTTKSIVANLRTVFDDFEFEQENFKACIVIRFRTKGSKGWWEG